MSPLQKRRKQSRNRRRASKVARVSSNGVLDAAIRNLLAIAIVVGVATLCVGSAIIGLMSGSFGHLQSVWHVVSPLVMLLTGYYFGMKNPSR